MAKTVSDLLTNIKVRGQIPDDSGTLSDANILQMASDELSNVVVPRIMAEREWHYAFNYVVTLSSAREYRMNSRVAGNAIISVEYYDGTNYRFIRQKHPLMQYTYSEENFSIYGNKIVLSSSCPTSGSLRVRALLRTSQLVSSGCTSISSYDTATNILAVASSSGFTPGQSIDVVYGDSPYETYYTNATISSIPDGTHIALSDDVTTDWPLGRVCPAETSDRVQLPDELHDYLAQRTVIRCMEARGFTQDMQNHMLKLNDLEAAFDRLISPRSRGEFKAIMPELYELTRNI